MDSLINAAARALAAGDPLAALQRVALREDAPALALRGIAMAQLGDFARARSLLRGAARAFGPGEVVARARCVLAEAETALASRDLVWPARALDAALATLGAHGDLANVAYGRYLQARRLLLIGRLEQAEQVLVEVQSERISPASRCVHQLVLAGIAMRRLQARTARAALETATQAAIDARIPALMAEVEGTLRVLNLPAARLSRAGTAQPLLLDEIETLLRSSTLVIDACRHGVRQAGKSISLARRPVLFTLLRLLGEAWPGEVSRGELIARAFRSRRADESYRARLRVEIGRLRRLLRSLLGVRATPRGFALVRARPGDVVVLAPLTDDDDAALLALLADAENWSTSALSLALSRSQRTVQRALESLVAAGKVVPVGHGRARRWTIAASMGITTSLLLPSALPIE